METGMARGRAGEMKPPACDSRLRRLELNNASPLDRFFSRLRRRKPLRQYAAEAPVSGFRWTTHSVDKVLGHEAKSRPQHTIRNKVVFMRRFR